jgi:DhnA family fructose-bisphosphate aldolase class Ia
MILMSVGKTIRMGSWFCHGQSFLAALDEVIPHGLEAVTDPAATLIWLAQADVDGVVLHAGIASSYAALLAELRLPWILKLTTNSRYAYDRAIRGAVGSVEAALTLGANGVAVNVFVGSNFEKEHFAFLSETVEAGFRWGMPVIAFINPPVDSQFDPDALAYAARIGAELGADVIKTDYSGSPDSFFRVTAVCPVPVLVEDTPLPQTAEGTLQTALGARKAGGAGVLFGRRLWGAENRKELAEMLKSIIRTGVIE